MFAFGEEELQALENSRTHQSLTVAFPTHIPHILPNQLTLPDLLIVGNNLLEFLDSGHVESSLVLHLR